MFIFNILMWLPENVKLLMWLISYSYWMVLIWIREYRCLEISAITSSIEVVEAGDQRRWHLINEGDGI